ncbi:hypothetical protein [Collimonas silvisoli]|uniref:hypothetical protein n=1 Tax=Collimonas silvisoli TaxID=2825884 RepID=UPI001B8DA04A|nr:hypothetical protein [Collimonas silvisoli]
MILKKKFEMMLLAAAATLPMQSHAAEPSTTLVGALSSCQNNFFAMVGAKRDALEKLTTIKPISDAMAFIPVQDRVNEKASVVQFSAPYQDGKVALTGYFDEIVDLATAGKYYSWGFLVHGNVRDVAKQLVPEIYEAGRLRKAGDVYVRSDVWKDGHWQKNDQLAGGTIPQPGTVERVLLIEDAAPDFPGAVRVGCSLQGSVTVEMLKSERPDI